MLRSIDGYVQAFGAPGFIKINAAWFGQTERGTFAGIFGFMINLGRLGINYFGAALLAGFTFLGMWQVPALHWRWLFWIPAGVATAVVVALVVVQGHAGGSGFCRRSRRRGGSFRHGHPR